MVPAGGDDALPVRRKQCIPHLVGVALQSGDQAAVGSVPYPRRLISAGGDDALPVLGEPRTPNFRGALQSGKQSAIGSVPYPRCVISAGGDDAPAVWREGSIHDESVVALKDDPRE